VLKEKGYRVNLKKESKREVQFLSRGKKIKDGNENKWNPF